MQWFGCKACLLVIKRIAPSTNFTKKTPRNTIFHCIYGKETPRPIFADYVDFRCRHFIILARAWRYIGNTFSTAHCFQPVSWFSFKVDRFSFVGRFIHFQKFPRKVKCPDVPLWDCSELQISSYFPFFNSKWIGQIFLSFVTLESFHFTFSPPEYRTHHLVLLQNTSLGIIGLPPECLSGLTWSTLSGDPIFDIDSSTSVCHSSLTLKTHKML